MKVEQFLNRNQFHLYGEVNGDIYHILQSYDSKVVEIREGETILGRDWDYSTTTSKHVYEFLIDYSAAKDTDGESISYKLKHVKNKRKYVYELINKGVIRYDEEMR